MADTSDIPHQPDSTEFEIPVVSENFNILDRIAKTHLWIDIETSGLDPTQNDIIEVGLTITDLAGKPLQSESWVIHQEQVSTKDWESDVIVMHGGNGLLVQCLTEGMSQASVEHQMVDFVQEFYGLGVWQLPIEARPTLSGSSVHFDHAFVQYHFPAFESQISYRHFDVSTLRQLVQKYQPDATFQKRESIHRVIPDINNSILEFQDYLGLLGLDENLPELPAKNPA